MIAAWRWRVLLADLDPAVGSEQGGTRPVVVVSDEDYNRIMPVVTVLPCTTRKRGRPLYPSEVLVPRGNGGLVSDSIVLAHQVSTISKERVVKPLGAIQNQLLRQQILEALKSHLDID